MCLIEFELYANIKPRELLNQHWAKEKYHHRAPNLLKLINRFNEIATWIQYEIVSTERVRDRVTRMQQTIKLADHLFRVRPPLPGGGGGWWVVVGAGGGCSPDVFS